MKYDFETLVDRSQNGSAKWNGMKDHNPAVAKNIAPLSVADLDLKLAPEIAEGMLEFMQNNPVFGYTNGTAAYYDAVINWMKDKHNYQVEKEWIVLSNGVVPALSDGVTAFTEENDGVIIFTPVYYPFYRAIELNNRRVQRCPLINHENSYQIDFDKFEELAKQANTKLLILCNPHNPVGRVWTKEELEKIADICLNNGIIILSDEIHEDLTMPGYTHYPIAVLSEVIGDITVTCTAPSKSFNIAGLQGSNIIIKNKELRAKFIAQQEKKGFFTLNTLSFEATRLAYTKGDAWLAEFKTLIHHNYDILVDFIKKNLPSVTVYPLEGTYLAWLDFRNLGYDYLELEKRMIAADLYLDEGYVFGQEGEGFERINIACPTWVLKEALERLKNAFSGPQVSN